MTPDQLDAEARRNRVTALLDTERAAGYRAAFKSAVQRIVMFATVIAGDRGLTKTHVVGLRTAIGYLVSDMESLAPDEARDELRAYAKEETERAFERLGVRK